MKVIRLPVRPRLPKRLVDFGDEPLPGTIAAVRLAVARAGGRWILNPVDVEEVPAARGRGPLDVRVRVRMRWFSRLLFQRNRIKRRVSEATRAAITAGVLFYVVVW